MKRRHLFISATIVCLALVFCFIPVASAERGVSETVIKVGNIADRSGPISNTALPVLAGVETYLRLTNSKGGVHGRKFDIIPADGQYKVEKVLFEYKRFVQREKIFMFFGPGNTGGGMALAPLIERDKVPEIVMMPSNQIIYPPRKYCFAVAAPRVYGTKILFDYIVHNLKMKDAKIGIIYPNIEYGKFFLRSTEERCKFYGIKLAAKLIQNLRDVNVVSQVLKLKSMGVEIVYVPTIEKCASIFLKDAASYGYEPLVMGTDGVTNEELLHLAGNKAAKNYFGFTTYASYYEDIPGSKLLVTLAEKYPLAKKYYDNKYFVCGVAQGMVAVEAFKRAGRNLTVEGFIKAMESLKDFDMQGITPPVTFGPKKRYACEGTRLYKVDSKHEGKFKAIPGIFYPREKPFD